MVDGVTLQSVRSDAAEEYYNMKCRTMHVVFFGAPGENPTTVDISGASARCSEGG